MDYESHGESSHGDEESMLMESREKLLLKSNSNKQDTYKRFLSILLAVVLCLASLACITASVGSRLHRMSLQVTSSADNMIASAYFDSLPSSSQPELDLTGDVAVQSVTTLYIKGKRFECANELLTTHCKPTPESMLHEPSNSTKANPIIYSTYDLKWLIVEFKNTSYMCPNENINEETCFPADEMRKACDKGEYNLEVIATEYTAMYFKCTQCPVNTYQSDFEFLGTECTSCPEGTSVSFVGAISSDRCTPTKSVKVALR